MILTIHAQRCEVSRERGYLTFSFEMFATPLYRDTHFTAKNLGDIEAEIARVTALVAEQNPGVTFFVSHIHSPRVAGVANRALAGYKKLSAQPHIFEVPAMPGGTEGREAMAEAEGEGQ